MKEGQAAASDGNHDPFHYYEQYLIVNKECAVESARELDAAINTSSKDGDSSDNKTDKEGFEETGIDEREVFLVPVPFSVPHTECKIDTTDGKQNQGADLEAEAGQHDILPNVLEGGGIRWWRNATSRCLQDQTDEVARAEDDGVGPWLKAREMSTI